MKLTKQQVKDYILALRIAITDKPLATIDETLKQYPEIQGTLDLLATQIKVVDGKRGNAKLEIVIPQELLTKNLNKAIRYGMPHVMHKYDSKPIRALDNAVGIAMADSFTGEATK